jgi:hypothetical protein
VQLKRQQARHHAVRQVRAEAAHVADGEHFRGHAHAELAVLEIADAPAAVRQYSGCFAW